MERTDLETNLALWLKDQPDAIAFCLAILRVAHTWDDLIDRDKPVEDCTLNQAFWTALIELPQNPFYVRHFASLHPVMQLGILNWQSANRLERSDVQEHRLMAFTLRCMIGDVITMSALLIAGPLWAAEVHYAVQIAYPESLNQYLASVPRTTRS